MKLRGDAVTNPPEQTHPRTVVIVGVLVRESDRVLRPGEPPSEPWYFTGRTRVIEQHNGPEIVAYEYSFDCTSDGAGCGWFTLDGVRIEGL